MSDFKRQHTVTCAYLRGFASAVNSGEICQFSKIDGSHRWVSPKNATTSKYIYSVKGADGSLNHAVELALGQVERDGMPALKNVLSGSRLTPQQRYNLAMFVAAMVRRPLHLHKHLQQAIADFAKDPVKLNGLVAKQRETLRKRHTDAEIAEFEKRIHSGDVQLNLDAGKRGHLRVWLERLPKLAEFLYAMQWQICKAKKGLSFITSDAPAYVRRDGFQHSDGIVGLVRADLGAKLYFPLSPKKFLIIGHETCEEKTELPKTRVRELNSQTIRMASRFVYSHEATQSTKDSILANNQFSPPVPNLNEVYK